MTIRTCPECGALWWLAMSVRQDQIIALIAEGRTNRQIAARLYLSVETVKSYVSDAMCEHRVANRTALVVSAIRRGELVIEREAAA